MQIGKHAEDLVLVPGSPSDATTAARNAAQGGAMHASHACQPHNIAGYATCGFEISERQGAGPGAVIVSADLGGLWLGLGRGSRALQDAGLIRDTPVQIGAQAAVCAPLVAPLEIGMTGLNCITEVQTVAEGVRVRTPLRADAVVKMVRTRPGRIVSVSEGLVLPGRDELGRPGFNAEPTSVLVWHALDATISVLLDPVVIILSGSGHKSTD